MTEPGRRHAGGRPWRTLRAKVLAQADYRCQLRIPGVCTATATCVDHMVPVTIWPQGELVLSNCCAACWPCNREKGDTHPWQRPRDPDELNPYDL